MAEIHKAEAERASHGFAGFLYYGMRFFVAFSTVVFAVREDWMAAFGAFAIFLLMLVPAFLKEQYRFYLPFELDLALVVFIFLTLFLGSLRDFYEQVTWWDNMLHLFSGILFGAVAFMLIYILNNERLGKLALSPFFASFFSVCFSLAMSVVWEVYEFGADTFFGFNMQRDGLPDTMMDLIVNAAGALIVATGAYLWMLRQRRVPFRPGRLNRFQFSHRSKT